tara:strand:- start:250 stop:420 length:171 start_codon:yes stop_codon:yes gene_type:complete
MKLSKSTKYSALFFLIFVIGIVFFVASIHKSLNKKVEIFSETENNQTEILASTVQE